MPTDVKEKTEQQEEQAESVESQESEFAVLFELEELAVKGREATFELLKNMLAEHSITFTEPQFSRFCCYSSPKFYVSDLLEVLGAKKISDEKFMEDVTSGMAMFFASKEAVLDAGLDRIIRAAGERKVRVGALTALSEEAGTALMNKLGLTERGVELFTFEEVEPGFPRADTWLKIAKAMSKSPRRCVVFASSATACKAALSAGMRCVAVPDKFTAFQDFGGAQLILDSLEECTAGELLDEFCPAAVTED